MTDQTNSIEDLLSNNSKSKINPKLTPKPSTKTKGKVDSEITPEEKLSGALSDIKIHEDEEKIEEKAQIQGVPYINLAEFPISNEALQTIPENICHNNNVICFLNTGEYIRLATTNPENEALAKISHSLKESFHSDTQIYLCSQRSLKKAFDLYSKLPKYKKSTKSISVTNEELEKFKDITQDLNQLQPQIAKTNITELFALIVSAALQANASDIHIEAEEADVKIRFRIDGILNNIAQIEPERWPKMISRIKLLAGLKVNIVDKPQDGRITIKLKDEDIDVRVSTLPTSWGESVVMRILRSSGASLKFEELGLTGTTSVQLATQVERPNGMIITTGPTGSGKTTTLYAILNKLNKEGTKIITLEDPIEYKVKGINQSQIDHSRGYTFADGLKSILRQDPDVIMVGELRDTETADTAINAALTGHLVISTLHTNSASGAIPRFLAMGVKPFLLAPALNAIIGQRLVRKICQECKQEITPDEKTLARMEDALSTLPEDKKPNLKDIKLYKGVGCPACNGLGYKGRIGIYEVMIMNKEIENSILSEKVSEYDMQEIAIKNGMVTMVQDGLLKAIEGITTTDEVFRVSE